jgi:hypothetical protein
MKTVLHFRKVSEQIGPTTDYPVRLRQLMLKIRDKKLEGHALSCPKFWGPTTRRLQAFLFYLKISAGRDEFFYYISERQSRNQALTE